MNFVRRSFGRPDVRTMTSELYDMGTIGNNSVKKRGENYIDYSKISQYISGTINSFFS